MDSKTDDQIGKLQSKIKRRNLELCAFVAIVGMFCITSLDTVLNYFILGAICVICAIAIMMVIFFGYLKRIRPVEAEIFELQQQVNGVNL